jgi:alkanesulfonate monooxygenase SsuD/methylene tetrahydromethanopterin reductase-like flavin-dependent oxidoreductase (luciferase family)
MKFGVFDHMDDAGGPLAKLYSDRLELIEAYDRSGIYGYHLAEHHSTPLGCAASPGLFLAALAQRTKSLRFGPLVYLLPFYHPLRLIEEICMLDQMSGGRLELGIGRGVSPFETRAYGLDFAQTGEIYHEAFQLILNGLTSDALTFEGKHYQFHKVPMILRPLQRPHPPLWYGITIPEKRRLAGGKRCQHRDDRATADGALDPRSLPRRTHPPRQAASSVHGGRAPCGGGGQR